MKSMLFNADMVRAILGGKKTVTRRLVKPQPPKDFPYCHLEDDDLFYWTTRDGDDDMMDWYPSYERGIKPPYHPGDILYVRETWGFDKHIWLYKADFSAEDLDKLKGLLRWFPSIHMPRKAARIFLRVTNVRVERLQSISRDDTVAEGAPCRVRLHGGYCGNGGLCDCSEYQREFAELWDSTVKPLDRAIYGWAANPWVWVIEFERISREEAVE